VSLRLSTAAALLLLAGAPAHASGFGDARARRYTPTPEFETPAVSPCPAEGDAIAIDTAAHHLWLCSDGTPGARYTIALGRGGLGKRQAGDERTPLGTYPVGDPRPSSLYGVFIPIGYPTPAQAARGFSGGSVGIHGPPRGVTYRATGLDWTLGCVATGTDAEVEAIAEWVRGRSPIVVIRAPASPAAGDPLASSR
jgi:L,D-transpeptidase-like protein